ncbi:hypothetical protein PENSPDRAFT_40467 [Peniophora sp. CONT]|nr:hypothetical protein PENSPDRAFT_40467 [Peniophora sp. CONT]
MGRGCAEALGRRRNSAPRGGLEACNGVVIHCLPYPCVRRGNHNDRMYLLYSIPSHVERLVPLQSRCTLPFHVGCSAPLIYTVCSGTASESDRACACQRLEEAGLLNALIEALIWIVACGLVSCRLGARIEKGLVRSGHQAAGACTDGTLSQRVPVVVVAREAWLAAVWFQCCLGLCATTIELCASDIRFVSVTACKVCCLL